MKIPPTKKCDASLKNGFKSLKSIEQCESELKKSGMSQVEIKRLRHAILKIIGPLIEYHLKDVYDK